MTALPASCRLSLWASAALAGRARLDEVPALSAPDYDETHGAGPWLELQRDLGERVVLCALARPGDVTLLPRGPAEFVGAAVEAGECVWVPALGGALVPEHRAFGAPGDEGELLQWRAFDTAPAPTHRIEALAAADIELALREELAEVTAELERLGAVPLAAAGLQEAARSGLDADLGVPEGMPPRVIRALALAAAVELFARLGADPGAQTVHASADAERRGHLGRLVRAADRALADATNLGALHLAGLR